MVRGYVDPIVVLRVLHRCVTSLSPQCNQHHSVTPQSSSFQSFTYLPKTSMMTNANLTLLALTILSILYHAAPTHAFTVSSPSESTYWVSNHTNTLNWKANSSLDADHFSVQILNTNQSSLIGNFQVGNALSTTNGTAQIQLDAIPAGEYTLLFVNSSNYELDHPQVYYTSPVFEIKPNGTQPADVQANTNAVPDDTASTATSAGAKPDATLSASGNEASQGASNSNATSKASSGGNAAGLSREIGVATIVSAGLLVLAALTVA